MTPTRSRTIVSILATLALGTLMAAPALGALTASPNPSTTGSYTVSDASPPTLPADESNAFYDRSYYYNLVETPPSGSTQSYDLGRGPVSQAFTGKTVGTYAYQLQTCVYTYQETEPEPTETTVCTNRGSSLSVTVSAPTANTAPVANAGADQTVNKRASVTLDGSGSSDSDDDTLTYAWSQTSGTNVTLTGATTSSPSFTAPASTGTLVFSLTVNDGTVASSADSVTVTVTNTAPVANAGTDQFVFEGRSVTLNGSGTDVDKDTLTYAWSQSSGTSVTLSSATAAAPTFTAPNLLATESLVFSLTVNDGTVESTADSVTVRVIADNDRPTANAGPDQEVDAGKTVTLSGSGTDPEGQALTYSWSQTSGTSVTLSSTTDASPTFTAPSTAGPLVFSLRVNDGVNDSLLSDSVTVTVREPDPPENRAPVADAGDDQTGSDAVNEGDTVTLDGSGSSDADADTLTYAWSQTSGTTVSLSSTTAASPTFTAPELLASENLVFSLTVNDGTVNSTADSVTVRVIADNDPPTANAGADQSVYTGATVTLKGSGTDPESQLLTYAWSQTSGTTVSLSSATAAGPTFTAPSTAGALVFSLKVNDGVNDSAADTVTVTVTVPPSARLSASPNPSTTGAYTVSGSVTAEAYHDWVQLVETLPGGTSQTHSVSDASNISLRFSSKAVGTYTYQAQGCFVVDYGSTPVNYCENIGSALSVTVSTPVNTAPVADAGDDQTGNDAVNEGDTVTLDGSDSSDADDDTLTYAWSQTLGTTVSLSSTTAVSPTFTAPELIASENLVFSLTVRDGTVNSAADTVTVRVIADNDPPTANAGADQGAYTGAKVTLNGSGTDPEGQPLKYAWTQIPAATVTLSDPTAARPTFTAPATAGALVFSFKVNDGVNDSAADTVTVSVTVPLSASPNPSKDGDYTVSWGSTPGTEAYRLYERRADRTTWTRVTHTTMRSHAFTGKAPARYVYRVDACVREERETGQGNTQLIWLCESTGWPELSVKVNTKPVADAGDDRIARPSTKVMLDGSGSSDGDGDGLTYLWSQIPDATVTLSSATAASPTFTAPSTAGPLTFSLTVNDGIEDSDPDTVTVKVNTKPVADAGDDHIVRPSAAVTLDGSASSDADGDSLTYAWTQTIGTKVTLSDPAAASPTFTAPTAAGRLVFSLTVNDGTEDSDLVSVTLTVNTKPVADAGPNQRVAPGTEVMLDGTGSADADGHALTYAWSKRPGTTVELTDADEATASFIAPELAMGQTSLTLEYQLVVNDEIEDSDPSLVTVTVSNAAVPTADAGDDQIGDDAVNEGDTVTLDGSASSDPNGQTLTYAWSGPSDVAVKFSDPAAARPTFVAPNLVSSRNLVLSLVVSNTDMIASAPDTVTVRVIADDDPPVAEAGENQTVRTGDTVTLDGTDSSDPENLPLQYTWSQDSGTTVSLSSTTASSPTFTAPPKAAVLTFSLSVSDGNKSDGPDTVTVTVIDAPPPPGSITGPERTADGSFTLTWGASDTTANVVYKLEQSIKGAAWTTVPGTDAMTSRSISGLTMPGPHAYRVSACLAGNLTTCSDPGDIHTVVYLPPGAMIANPNPSATGDYTVSWTPVADIGLYRLYESTDAGATWKLLQVLANHRYHVSGQPAGEYRYKLELCYRFSSDANYRLPDYCFATEWDPIKVTVKYPAEPALTDTGTEAGTLPYATGVTKGGDAYINIPIEPAPGVNGLEPMLSIDYSGGRDRTRMASSLPGDTLGYGWRVSGFSTIRRCIRNQAATTTLTISDRAGLCLDGEPLVLTSGTHMRSGAVYRTLRESFARIQIKGPTDNDRRGELWFEVRLPDGSVREYGRFEDSRLKQIRYVLARRDRDSERELFGGDEYQREVTTAHYLWSINKHTDAFGNTMRYTYLEDERKAIRHPARIMYGETDAVTGAHDAVISFQYVPRSDLEAVYMGPAADGVAQRQDLRLLAVQVALDAKPVRTYRFKSRTKAGRQQLEKIQLCGFDTSGLTSECLKPISVGWKEPAGTVPHTVIGVNSFTDPLGRVTQFKYESLTKSGAHTFLFSERPFGTPTEPADVAALAPAPLGAGETAPPDGGAVKTVVTRVRRSNGRNGWHHTDYAYHGRGFASTRHWGYLGFYATRETDVESGVVTYTQYRLDYPYYGEIAAVHQYQGAYTSSARVLSRRVIDYAHKSLAHSGGARTVLPYVERSTDWLYERATTLGVTQRQTALALSGNLLGSATETVTTGHSVSASGSGTVWGDAPTYTVGGVQRKTVSTVSLNNLATASRWLIGFAKRVEVAHHKGASATAERTQTATFTRHGQTNRVDTVTRFPGDTQHRLTTDYGYTATGLLNSVNVSGANVASRTTSATSFSDGRYPSSVTNALKHVEGFAYDARFGLPTRYTDANGRITRVSYDAFGREKTRTTPDGVVISTAYGVCPSTKVTCSNVSGASPAMWVSADSPVSPKSVEYLDKLGRVIHTEVEAFTGTGAYRRHVVYDKRGRVKSVSEPYTSTGVNASAPTTTYSYDVRDRVVRVSRPDGGSTTVAYTGRPDHRVRVRVTETLSNTAKDTPSTQRTDRYYNVLGELVRSIDGAGATGAAANTDTVYTTYTYDGSGLPDTVSVRNTATARPTAKRSNSITTDFDHDAAGNRSRVVHPNFGTVTFAYTALGELRQRKEGTYTTTYSYDVLGRLEKRDDPDGVAQWTYDPANAKGALDTRCYDHSSTATQCDTTPGFKETLDYNMQSRPSSSTMELNVGMPKKTYVHRYTYDTHGRLSTTTYPTGLTVRSDYNARGYLESLTDKASGSMLERYRALNAYGQVTQQTHANGVSTVRAFDPKSGRLTGIDTTVVTTKGTTVLQDYDYAWQSNGILKSRISHRGGMNARTETFTYDALDRLKSAVTDLTGNASARTLSMTYDRLGNLQTKSSTVSGDTGASSYAYGDGKSGNDPLTALTGVSIGGVSHTLTHDDWGRVEKYDRAGTTDEDRYLGWNARHLPTTVTVGDSLTDTTPVAKDEFLYGPDGQRYYKKSTWKVPGADPMTATTYAVEHTYYAGTHREVVRVGDTVNASIATSAVSATVLHVKTTPVTGAATTAFEYLHRDHLGSVESVTNAGGEELKIQAYDPFGSRRASDWTRDMTDDERKSLAGEAPQRTARGYTGHEHLERTGLIHMNGRVYDPVIGRFLSPDPIVANASFSQSWNAYSYALNSPMSYSDPSGTTLVGGCPPSLCSGGGFGGRGGYGPSSVLAASGHATVGVGVIWSYGVGFGLPGVSMPSRMIYVQDPSADGGARGGASLENRSGFGFPTRTPRPFVSVFYQQVRAWVGIGEEQSPADLPIQALETGVVFVAEFLILDAIYTAQDVVRDVREEQYAAAGIGVASIACDLFKGCKAFDKAFEIIQKVRSGRRALPREGIYEFPDQKAGGATYVGQSKDIQRRLQEHQAAGRYIPGTETVTEVLGGKTTREVAEYHRIRQLTGDIRAKDSPVVSNKVDPIGIARQHLLE